MNEVGEVSSAQLDGMAILWVPVLSPRLPSKFIEINKAFIYLYE